MHLRSYREKARQAISAAEYPVIKVACLYALPIFAAYLIINCVSVYVDSIETGGLSNAIALNGVSSVIYCLSMILSLFSGAWLVCFRAYCIRLNRDSRADYRSLLSELQYSFRYFRVYIRVAIKQLLWTCFLTFVFSYIVICIYTANVISAEVVSGLTDYEAVLAYLSEALTDEVLSSIFTAISISAIVAYVFAFFLTYKYRMTSYFAIWTDYPISICLGMSRRLLKGHKKEFFSLELSFANYWALYLLPSALLVLYDAVSTLSDSRYCLLACLVALISAVIEIVWLPELECTYAFYATDLFDAVCAEQAPKEQPPLLPEA